jgi:hypothetical protein
MKVQPDPPEADQPLAGADQPKAETGADHEVRHRLIENRGASIRDKHSARVEKENKKILTGTSVPLDLPANRRPGVHWTLRCVIARPDRNFNLCPANQHWVRRTSSKREIFQSTAGEEVVNQYVSR